MRRENLSMGKMEGKRDNLRPGEIMLDSLPSWHGGTSDQKLLAVHEIGGCGQYMR